MMQLSASLSHTTLFVIGLLTGFHCVGMCGSFVVSYSKNATSMGEAARLHVAYGTGSPTEGGLMLASFGLGTLPALIGFGFFASYLSHQSIRQLVHVSAVLVIFMGLMMFNRGYALLSNVPNTIGG